MTKKTLISTLVLASAVAGHIASAASSVAIKNNQVNTGRAIATIINSGNGGSIPVSQLTGVTMMNSSTTAQAYGNTAVNNVYLNSRGIGPSSVSISNNESNTGSATASVTNLQNWMPNVLTNGTFLSNSSVTARAFGNSVINHAVLNIDGGSANISIDHQQVNSGTIAATVSNANNAQPADFSGSTVNQTNTVQAQALGNSIMNNVALNGNIVGSATVAINNSQSNTADAAVSVAQFGEPIFPTAISNSNVTSSTFVTAEAFGNSISNGVSLDVAGGSSAVTVVNNQLNSGATVATVSNAINAMQPIGWTGSMTTQNDWMMAQASGNSLSNNIVLNATPEIAAGTALNAPK
jgi:hypothetical protein